MKRQFAYLKLIWALIRISRNPENTPAVFDIADALYKIGAHTAARKKIAADPQSLEVIQQRKLIQPYELHELQKLPLGTLGRAYADHMLSLGLDPNFYRHVDIKNDTTFVMMRLRQTHDLWHVITGFDTSVAGEIALQAFLAAQTNVPLSFILISGSLFRTATKAIDSGDLLMENIIKGWQLGKKAKPVFALDWEANWPTPLEDLRREYQISP